MRDNFQVVGNHLRLWETRAPRVLVEGPSGTGKTRNELERINFLAWRYPMSRHLICRKTRASMSESVLVTWERDVHKHSMHLFGMVRRQHREVYRYPNGSTVVVGGLDKPERTYSAEYDTVTVFEGVETTDDEVEQLLRALRSNRMPFQQLVIDCNPSFESHWLNVRANRGWLERIITTHKDNPRFWDESGWTEDGQRFMGSLDALTGHRRKRLLEGRWSSAEGVVYDCFDPSIHVIDQMPNGWQSWMLFRSIDFGYNDPFCCQWWADNGEALFLYREIYMTSRIVSDHAEQINKLTGDEQIQYTVADHDREDRETLHRSGIYTRPAEKDIDRGLDAVRSRLLVGGNGRPRLFVLRNCRVEQDGRLAARNKPTTTEQEFNCYLWAARKDGDIKDRPIDRDNHGMDALRYAVMSVDGSSSGGSYIGQVNWME